MSDEHDLPLSPYDRDTREEDLWFLPGPLPDEEPETLPLPQADRRALFNPADWLRAEKENTLELIGAAVAFARLDERMAAMDEDLRKGMAQRFAITQIRDLIWQEGSAISIEKLTLYLVLRVSGVEQAQILSSANWALRRLIGSIGPERGLALFLERHVSGDEESWHEATFRDPVLGTFDNTGNRNFGQAASAWQNLLADFSSAHELTQAAVAFYAWSALEVSGEGRLFDASVVAAKWVARAGQGAMPFTPLSVTPVSRAGKGNPASDKLYRFLRRIQEGSLRALMHLSQLQDWQEHAQTVTSDLSGRTAPALVKTLLANPVLSTDMAAKLSKCSKPTALRNLACFETRGLIRELTGQERYRFWVVKFG